MPNPLWTWHCNTSIGISNSLVHSLNIFCMHKNRHIANISESFTHLCIVYHLYIIWLSHFSAFTFVSCQTFLLVASQIWFVVPQQNQGEVPWSKQERIHKRGHWRIHLQGTKRIFRSRFGVPWEELTSSTGQNSSRYWGWTKSYPN